MPERRDVAAGWCPVQLAAQLQGWSRTQFDTQVQRRFDADLPAVGSTDTVEIELVQLQLVSCAPITVQTGPDAVQWDVSVDLLPFGELSTFDS